jgi:enamine deaminase RidA (YjgF/YER057c/UK114 family)
MTMRDHRRPRRCGRLVTALLLCIAGAPVAADAQEIVRRQQGTFPIASTVTVPPGTELVFVSGMLPDVANPQAPEGSVERYGDTEAQAASVFHRIAAALEAAGLRLADVVRMNVYLVGDPALGGRMDFDGLMRAYSRHYGGTAQPNLPARTTVQVVALPRPGALVEIEVIAARAVASR